MIDRLAIVAAIALSIIWQSGCLTFDDGMLVNRCGLWQWFTGKPMIVSLGEIKERIVFEQAPCSSTTIAPATSDQCLLSNANGTTSSGSCSSGAISSITVGGGGGAVTYGAGGGGVINTWTAFPVTTSANTVIIGTTTNSTGTSGTICYSQH